jgi:hypothetical protein
MKRIPIIAWLCCVTLTAHAAPGAHGPNGEHLDAPATVAGAATTLPVIEANTEGFELVGTLHEDELSVLVDRYDTNEPVTTGTLDVELGTIKAQSKLHHDIGDFSFTDPKLLAALRQPGDHALVFTLVTGNDTDLIEGKLAVAPGTDSHGHRQLGRVAWFVAALLAVLLLIAIVWRIRARRSIS